MSFLFPSLLASPKEDLTKEEDVPMLNADEVVDGRVTPTLGVTDAPNAVMTGTGFPNTPPPN